MPYSLHVFVLTLIEYQYKTPFEHLELAFFFRLLEYLSVCYLILQVLLPAFSHAFNQMYCSFDSDEMVEVSLSSDKFQHLFLSYPQPNC
jgi:hypothetical protein